MGLRLFYFYKFFWKCYILKILFKFIVNFILVYIVFWEEMKLLVESNNFFNYLFNVKLEMFGVVK